MRQQYYWFRRGLLVMLVLATGAVVSLKWVVPRYVVGVLERLGGGTIIVEQTRIAFPLTTTLRGVRLANNSAESALTINKVVMAPVWYSPFSRTLWLHSLRIDRPLIRVTRSSDGPVLPSLDSSAGSSDRAPSWRIRVQTLELSGGVMELIDQTPETPFHGAVEHLALTVGPVIITSDGIGVSVAPTEGAVSSFAVRGKVVGYAGASAPVYCSGWIDLSVKDLQVSCSLEPLPLIAFDPYYHGRPEFRVYTATVKSTSQWSARSNQLTGRLQLELNNLSEGDLSIRGRTIVDIKDLMAKGEVPRLSGEISFSGLLDDPRGWHAEFLPGDDTVRDLVQERLLEYGVKMVRFPLLQVNLTNAIQKVMPDIEAASREIQDALELLAGPIPGEVPKAVRYGPWPTLEEYSIYEAVPVEPADTAPVEEAGEGRATPPVLPSADVDEAS